MLEKLPQKVYNYIWRAGVGRQPVFARSAAASKAHHKYNFQVSEVNL